MSIYVATIDCKCGRNITTASFEQIEPMTNALAVGHMDEIVMATSRAISEGALMSVCPFCGLSLIGDVALRVGVVETQYATLAEAEADLTEGAAKGKQMAARSTQWVN